MASNSPTEVNTASDIPLSTTQTLEFDDVTLRGKKNDDLILNVVWNFFSFTPTIVLEVKEIDFR